MTDKKRLMDEREADDILHWLMNGQFHMIYRGRDLRAFRQFVREFGVPAHGFLLTLEDDEGGLAWFFYPIESYDMITGDVVIPQPQMFFDAEAKGPSRECPEQWKGYPVYRVF